MPNLTTLIVNETKRRLIEESLPRVEKCVNLLSTDQIWYKHNDNTNSVGNLVLHLCGNIQQWIVSGLGKKPDTRARNIEFSSIEKLGDTILIEKFRTVMQEVEIVLKELKESDLSELHLVQVYEETGVSILMHVVEHCSYHVGQITYLTKFLLDVDTAYYSEALE